MPKEGSHRIFMNKCLNVCVSEVSLSLRLNKCV